MARQLLIWIGATLEISAVAIALFVFFARPDATTVLVTGAAVLAFNGASLQVFSTEVPEGT